MNKKITIHDIQRAKNRYIYEQFNSKRLQNLLYCFLSYFYPQAQKYCNGRGTPISVLNSSNLTLLLSHLKLYDNKIIEKQNRFLSSFQLVIKQNTASNKQNQCTKKIVSHHECFDNQNNVKIGKILVARTITEGKEDTLNNKISTKINKINVCAIIQQIDIGCKVFTIYQNRLKDLNSLINCMSEIIIKSKIDVTIPNYLTMTISELRILAKRIMDKIQKIKNIIQNLNSLLSKNHQQGLQKNKKYQKEDIIYFNWKAHSKQIQEKIKEIQQKYSNITKQILNKQEKLSDEQTFRQNNEHFDLRGVRHRHKQSEVKNNESLSQEQEQENDNSNQVNIPNRVSNKSILKTSKNMILNKLVEAKMKNWHRKRTSMEILTDVIEKEEGRKQLRQMHRDGVYIGNGKTIEKSYKESKGIDKNKQKKHVQIDSSPDLQSPWISRKEYQGKSSMSSTEKNIPIRRSSKKFRQSKSRKQIRRQSDLSISSSNSIRFKSNQELSASRSVSSISSGSKGKIKFKECKKLKLTKKYSINLRSKSFVNEKYSKKIASMKMIKNKSMSKSLKKITLEVVGCKKEVQQKEETLQKQAQKSVDSKRFINSVKSIKPQNKARSKEKKKNKYNEMYNNLLNSSTKNKNSKEKIKRQISHEQEQIKPNRRMGIKINNFIRNQVKIETEPLDLQENNKNVIKNRESKKYVNNRVKHEQTKEKQYRTAKMRKFKTQEKLNVPREFKVNIEDIQVLPSHYVRFYPTMECTLYKTTKKYQNEQDYLKYIQNCAENVLIEMDPIPNFYVKKNIQNECLLETKETLMKKQIFFEDNEKIAFCKTFINSFNKVEQKGLIEVGNSDLGSVNQITDEYIQKKLSKYNAYQNTELF